MTPEEFKKIVDDALKPVADKVTALEAKAKAAETATPAKAAADTTVIDAITNALKPVTDQLAALDAQHKDTLKAQAKAGVAKYIGRPGLAPQDTKAIEFFEKAYLADPAGTEEVLGKLPARASAQRFTSASSGTETATANDFSEPENRVLKAAAKANETLKLPNTAAALDVYLRTPEGNAAYAEILAGRSEKRRDVR